MTEQPPGIDDYERTTGHEITCTAVFSGICDCTTCKSCGLAFDARDTRFDGRGRFHNTVWCRACVDRCHDSEIADHWCAVCR